MSMKIEEIINIFNIKETHMFMLDGKNLVIASKAKYVTNNATVGER